MKVCSFFNVKYRITTGFFAENTIVLAEGEMLLDGIFQVNVCFALELVDHRKPLRA